MALVVVGVLAQAVVDVEGADLLGAARAHREVEHADRVAPAGEQRHDRRRGGAIRPPARTALEQWVGVHPRSLGARRQRRSAGGADDEERRSGPGSP